MKHIPVHPSIAGHPELNLEKLVAFIKLFVKFYRSKASNIDLKLQIADFGGHEIFFRKV